MPAGVPTPAAEVPAPAADAAPAAEVPAPAADAAPAADTPPLADAAPAADTPPLADAASAADAAPAPRWLRLPADGIEMAARAWGPPDGAPAPDVVCVHGLVVSSRYMVPLAERLATRHRVLAVDLPGFGASGKPPEALDVRALARSLNAWLDAASLRRPALVANSFGCQVVAEALLQRPDAAASLVLLAPTMQPRLRASVPRLLRRWRQEQRTQTRALKSIQLRDYARAGPRRAVATARHALADPIEDKLGLLDLPALVVRGTRDPIVDDRWAQDVADLLPQGRLAVIPGATHAINHEMPSETARVVEHFLAAGQGGRGQP